MRKNHDKTVALIRSTTFVNFEYVISRYKVRLYTTPIIIAHSDSDYSVIDEISYRSPNFDNRKSESSCFVDVNIDDRILQE